MRRRDRFSKSPVGPYLTLSENLELAYEETFILEKAFERFGFVHWVAHVFNFEFAVRGIVPYSSGEDFEAVRTAVADGLSSAGFGTQAGEVASAKDEQTLNQTIIRQYTDEVGLYERVNLLLRTSHAGEQLGEDPLAPWILQLNSSIRLEPEYTRTSYRGAEMTEEDMDKYEVGEFFVWSPFTSASRTPEDCLEGNVLFELKPVSGISDRAKRAPRDIAKYSVYPEENEVLFPICCSYRVTQNSYEDSIRKRVIKAEVVDHN